jgi:hypothetical protein
MDHLGRALRELKANGLLLLQDPQLPNLATLIAGEPIRGSWWAHPKGNVIFRVANELEDLPDVTLAKLVSKKVTFVHRDLFAALVAVGKSQESWQLAGLGSGPHELLSEVERAGKVQVSGKDAKLLEERLLVHAEQVHTDSGKHVLELSTWTSFQKRQKLGRLPSSKAARATLEEAVTTLSNGAKAPGRLPWSAPRR